MSTIHNIHGDMAAGTSTLQPTDEIAIWEASTGLPKKLTGALVSGVSGGAVVTTATSLSLSATAHGNRVLVVNTNSTVANSFTLPAATGTGNVYTILNGIAQTQGSIAIKTAGSDVMKGGCRSFDSTAVATHANFFVTLTATQCAWSRTTTGGIGHDRFIAYDTASGVWNVVVETNCSGANATPFT